jgi:hypothetical protein
MTSAPVYDLLQLKHGEGERNKLQTGIDPKKCITRNSIFRVSEAAQE